MIQKLKKYIPEEAQPYFLENNCKIVEIKYPVLKYPIKINSLNLEKTSAFSGKLVGIKVMHQRYFKSRSPKAGSLNT